MSIHLQFTGAIWFWRGPAPWFFVTVPPAQSLDLHDVSGIVTYGWGMIPVEARIGKTSWTTSLFPKDGQYLLPVKAAVRKAERIDDGDTVTVQLTVHV